MTGEGQDEFVPFWSSLHVLNQLDCERCINGSKRRIGGELRSTEAQLYELNEAIQYANTLEGVKPIDVVLWKTK